jgi:SNF2 family DNA or RNA helicase
MGLGKTLQTISFLQFLKDKYPGSTQLVICPTSLIFNWENEMKKFCPTLKFHIHYGLQREFSETHFNGFDVVLTTYGVVRNDIEQLGGFLWQYIILDESQAIKNPDARVTKALQQLQSVNRLLISGTPVQNNTSDLYSQFNFANPGLLGSREYFNREFATPIDKLGSKEKTQQLRKLIHPFTLRRTKEQVAKDLPDKTITVLWCTMEPEQRKLYNEYRDGYRKKLLKKIDEEGITKSGIDVLEGLLRLRQICDHPALVTKNNEADYGSAKVEELIREVQENAGNHKLLIFSQFTEMLGLIKEQFEKNDIKHCYLDGSTSLNQRKEQVTTFQEDESIKAFLISLKAGGVGLNLTVADYVYIVDPWWNPAAEMQAIDRAHRIGQTRKVFAYKMICKDSVEERILQMQERKKMLADDLIQEDSGFVKNLSREDIEFLFG